MNNTSSVIKILVFAAAISTAVAVLSLLTFPSLRMIVPLFIINIFYIFTHIKIEDPGIVLFLTYVISGFVILLPALGVNIALTYKLSLKYKIISVCIFVVLFSIATILLVPYLQYQIDHQSLYGGLF